MCMCACLKLGVESRTSTQSVDAQVHPCHGLGGCNRKCVSTYFGDSHGYIILWNLKTLTRYYVTFVSSSKVS